MELLSERLLDREETYKYIGLGYKSVLFTLILMIQTRTIICPILWTTVHETKKNGIKIKKK